MAPPPAMLRRDSTTMWEADSEMSMRESTYGDDFMQPVALEELQGQPGLVCQITGHSKLENGAVVYHIVTEYTNRIGDADAPSRPVAQMQQRYSGFRTLHMQCRKGLKVHFKVAPHILRDADWVKEERVVKLTAYLNDCLRSAQARDMELPEALRAFLGIDDIDLDKLQLLPEIGKCSSTAAALTARAATLLKKVPSAADLKTKVEQVVVSGREATTSLSTAWPAGRAVSPVRLALGALLVLLLAVACSQSSQPPVHPALPSQATSVALLPQAILAQGARLATARAAIGELGLKLWGDVGGRLEGVVHAANVTLARGQQLRDDLGPKLEGMVHAAEGGIKRGVESAKGGIRAAQGGIKSTVDAARARLRSHTPAAAA